MIPSCSTELSSRPITDSFILLSAYRKLGNEKTMGGVPENGDEISILFCYPRRTKQVLLSVRSFS